MPHSSPWHSLTLAIDTVYNYIQHIAFMLHIVWIIASQERENEATDVSLSNINDALQGSSNWKVSSPLRVPMMDEDRPWRNALKYAHHKLRAGVIVDNILPELRPHFTGVEYSKVESKQGDVAQVDELISILLTKEDKHFDEFCRCLQRNGYPHLARQLRADANVNEAEGTYTHVNL